ncbi:hypothetical protein ABIA10_007508 [Rhizobium leguminosarum]|jgi:hypothetical protein|uniref:Uncharacterized protein n=1 Tax=Rhizobium leguminosarum bv. trifolii TaxID=386 RepID=A0A1C9I3H1_RHILT|nr:hypothetical protein [Rhizobium leguminosarum bv. trifolii]
MSDGTREEEPPTHYLRQDNDGSGTQVWRIQDSEAVRLGVSNPEQGAGTYIKRGKRASIWAALREDTPWFIPTSANQNRCAQSRIPIDMIFHG